MFATKIDNSEYRVRFFHGLKHTSAELFVDGSPVAVGYADLHPKDNFVKAIGRKIALQRALQEQPKEVRSKLWQKYWSISPTSKLNVAR